jgi:hypothetical protein
MPKKKTLAFDRKTRRALKAFVRPRAQDCADEKPMPTKTKKRVNFGKTTAGANSATSYEQILLPRITTDILVHPYDTQTFGHMHLTVFAHLFPKIDYIFVTRRTKEISNGYEESLQQLGFFSARDYDTFTDWLEGYLKKFGPCTGHAYPPPIDGHYPFHAPSKPHKSYEEEWLWIIDNCAGEVRHGSNLWLFADEDDACLFELWK